MGHRWALLGNLLTLNLEFSLLLGCKAGFMSFERGLVLLNVLLWEASRFWSVFSLATHLFDLFPCERKWKGINYHSGVLHFMFKAPF